MTIGSSTASEPILKEVCGTHSRPMNCDLQPVRKVPDTPSIRWGQPQLGAIVHDSASKHYV